ncbi:MAG: DUF4258 domain-containing protein [Flavobacteriales bacterium]|jgi:hypothetical protein|nr:DUF4258 domain-containing protein [Flavobacteriales bacterium]MBT5090755.1 DUF4258 domain-containing protein [Flavobacteriales bacterium]MBT5750440.1 DUF4258 domain-containing protein [Flavobacteriales bacterium]
MRRRLLFFGFGALISIFFLSMGPENRLKETFYAYLDYFDMNQRVISHLYPNTTDDEGNVLLIDPEFSTQAECQLMYYNLTKKDLLSVLEDGEVNFELSDEDGEPCQYFVIENSVKGNALSVTFELCYYNDKSVKVISFTFNNENGACDF